MCDRGFQDMQIGDNCIIIPNVLWHQAPSIITIS